MQPVDVTTPEGMAQAISTYRTALLTPDDQRSTRAMREVENIYLAQRMKIRRERESGR